MYVTGKRLVESKLSLLYTNTRDKPHRFFYVAASPTTINTIVFFFFFSFSLITPRIHFTIPPVDLKNIDAQDKVRFDPGQKRIPL